MIDPRTPVLVGAAAVQQRCDDPAEALEAVDLMAAAAVAAAADAGAPSLRSAVEQIWVPEGTWSYADPGRLLASRLGAGSAAPVRTVVADVGITQQQVIGEACAALGAGDARVVLDVGGEARYRALRARIAGVEAPETGQPEGTAPDRRIVPDSLGIHDLELTRNAVTPSTAYALIESARRHHLGLGDDEQRRMLGDLYAGMARVAAANPVAWDRTAYTAAEIVEPGPDNRMIASPYTKRMCSQWNVDQAAALLLCTAEAADDAGVPRDRWVFPHSSVVANHAVPVLQRPQVWHSPNSVAAADAALAAAGVGADDLGHVDLYSCFPAAVQTYADALDLGLGLGLGVDGVGGVGGVDGVDGVDRDVTVTGGMSLAGGPLNNYVLMALAAMVPRLRADPTGFGLSSSVSGFLTKAGFGVWSATPPRTGFRHDDVTARVVAAAHTPDPTGAGTTSQIREVDAEYVGPAQVVAWTVDHDRGEPQRAVVFVDTPAGQRTMASTGDAATCRALLTGDWAGATVEVRSDGSFLPA
jgi:acetyl-CoA C-acetyltransferase